jgi:hypothetical protein
MRVAFGLVGLALSVVAIGACEEPHYKDADAVTCMAYLALQSTAVTEGRMTGDATALDTAAAAWRSLAEQKYTADDSPNTSPAASRYSTTSRSPIWSRYRPPVWSGANLANCRFPQAMGAFGVAAPKSAADFNT